MFQWGKLLTTRTIGSIAATAKKPPKPPVQWIIATDGSASPSSVEQPASAGWGFVVDRVGVLTGVEVASWGEALTEEKDPRALGADSLTNNSGELWDLVEAFLWLWDESGDDKSILFFLACRRNCFQCLTTSLSTDELGDMKTACLGGAKSGQNYDFWFWARLAQLLR